VLSRAKSEGRPGRRDGNQDVESESESKSNRICSRAMTERIMIHILFYATINLGTTIWATWLRLHLMLYRVFCLRWMMGSGVLIVVSFVDLGLCIFRARLERRGR